MTKVAIATFSMLKQKTRRLFSVICHPWYWKVSNEGYTHFVLLEIGLINSLRLSENLDKIAILNLFDDACFNQLHLITSNNFSQLPFDSLEDKFVETNIFLIQWIISVLIPKYRINLIVFSKGSIVAEFKLIFHVNDEPKDAYGMLKREINDGNLGTLRVDPSSLEQIPSPTEGDFITLP